MTKKKAQEEPKEEVLEEISLKQKDYMLVQARRWIVSRDKSFAGVCMYAQSIIDDTPRAASYVACTDGTYISYGDKYFHFKDVKERAGVTVHEILHIAFRHPQRRGNRHPKIWNYANDAVINAGILKLSKWLSLPGDPITFEKIIDSNTLRSKKESDWTSEAVYDYLVEKEKEKLKELLEQLRNGKGEPEEGEGDGQPMPGGSSGDPTLDELLDQLAEELAKRFPQDGNDLKSPPKGENRDLDQQVWERRLNRALTAAGTQPNSIIGQLLNEFPKSVIPWEVLLRQYMKTACMPKTKDNWARPGRHMLGSKSKIFSPGIKPQNGLQKAVVIVDTSGSIYGDPMALNSFASEITAIQKQTGCIIELIYADADVAAVYTVKNDGRDFTDKLKEGKFKPEGGGGTDFVPAVELARTYEPAVVVYLTDGEGRFPTTTYGMNLLWVITTDIKAPVGKTIPMKIN